MIRFVTLLLSLLLTVFSVGAEEQLTETDKAQDQKEVSWNACHDYSNHSFAHTVKQLNIIWPDAAHVRIETGLAIVPDPLPLYIRFQNIRV